MPYYGEAEAPIPTEPDRRTNAYCAECGKLLEVALWRPMPHIMCPPCLERVNTRVARLLQDIDVEGIYGTGRRQD